MKKRFSACLATSVIVALAMAVTTVVAGSNARAEDGYRGLTVSPATQSIDLKNGETKAGEVNISNGSDSDMKLKFTVGSYTIVNNNYSAPNYDSPSKYSVIRDWIKLDKSEATLKPNETVVLKYTINTPDNPPAGMQYATIFAETVPTQTQGSGIIATSRVGMVLSARMADGKTIDKASIQNEKIAGFQPKSPLKATFDIKNEGNVGVGVSYSMVIKNALNGSEVYSSKDQSSNIYPETTRSYSVEWDKVGIGFYNVEMTISVNGRTHSTKQTVCTIPAWIIALVVVGIVSIIAFFIVGHRNRRLDREKQAAAAQKKRDAKVARAKVADKSATDADYNVPAVKLGKKEAKKSSKEDAVKSDKSSKDGKTDANGKVDKDGKANGSGKGDRNDPVNKASKDNEADEDNTDNKDMGDNRS